MRIQIVRQLRSVTVELLKLGDEGYELLTVAAGGQEFVTAEVFEMRFTRAACALTPRTPTSRVRMAGSGGR
jgi:hypothetical protein